MLPIREALGAENASGTVIFVLFVPTVDRHETPIDHEYWRDEALRVLGRLFRGATAYPKGRGVWRDDERGGTLVFGDTSIVQCWAEPSAVTPEALLELRAFLHRMGREARQGEVGVVVDNAYLPIRNFEPEAKP